MELTALLEEDALVNLKLFFQHPVQLRVANQLIRYDDLRLLLLLFNLETVVLHVLPTQTFHTPISEDGNGVLSVLFVGVRRRVVRPCLF